MEKEPLGIRPSVVGVFLHGFCHIMLDLGPGAGTKAYKRNGKYNS